jgi:hypothetical protein
MAIGHALVHEGLAAYSGGRPECLLCCLELSPEVIDDLSKLSP